MPDPGDVLRMWDRFTKPQKAKLLICVHPERQLSMRINSRAVFGASYQLRASEFPFLHHDSYVEVHQPTRHFQAEIEEAEKVGALTTFQIDDLCAAIRAERRLSEETKDRICQRFEGIV